MLTEQDVENEPLASRYKPVSAERLKSAPVPKESPLRSPEGSWLRPLYFPIGLDSDQVQDTSLPKELAKVRYSRSSVVCWFLQIDLQPEAVPVGKRRGKDLLRVFGGVDVDGDPTRVVNPPLALVDRKDGHLQVKTPIQFDRGGIYFSKKFHDSRPVEVNCGAFWLQEQHNRKYQDYRQHEAGVEHAAICQAGQHLSYERLLQASRHEVLLLTLQLVKS